MSAFFRRLSRVLSPAIRNYQRHSMKGIRLMRGNFAGLSMLYGMFTVWNPWIFFDDSLLRLGLSWKEWGILLLSIYVLWQVDIFRKDCVSGIKSWSSPLSSAGEFIWEPSLLSGYLEPMALDLMQRHLSMEGFNLAETSLPFVIQRRNKRG